MDSSQTSSLSLLSWSDSDASFTQGLLFSVPHHPGMVPRRTILVKRSRYSDNINVGGMLRASHARQVCFNMDDTVVVEFEKVPPAERHAVWYNPTEEAAMAQRWATPRSSSWRQFWNDAVASNVFLWLPTRNATSSSSSSSSWTTRGKPQFDASGLFGETRQDNTDDDDDDDNTAHSKLANAKDQVRRLHAPPTRRLSTEQARRQQRMVQENQSVARRALVMMGCLCALLLFAAWNTPPAQASTSLQHTTVPALVVLAPPEAESSSSSSSSSSNTLPSASPSLSIREL